MSQTIIEVDNVSKLYKIGTIGTGTFSHDLNRWLDKFKKKEDASILAGEINNRQSKNASSYVWSLKDVSFDIKQGEIFGIIGSNGAGKSTLLKILSKITKPSKGEIKIDGRIASLLEVGTGFHPELTGRENVFLNGAILGMRKQEIKNRFDEIIDFSGIGKYIDTPVKKYSSGMYVRLAFAVAAHLQPDILIIDEVLAVGDAEFQAKCLGKMEDVSKNHGRTVIFVSHNIAAIKQLCNKAILLEYGQKKAIGNINDVVGVYQEGEADVEHGKRAKLPIGKAGHFTDWALKNNNEKNSHSCYTGDTCIFSFGFHAFEKLRNCEVRFTIKYDDLLIVNASSLSNNGHHFSITPGEYKFTFKVNFPVRDAKFDIAAEFISLGKTVDAWASTTKLTVLDTFISSVSAGVINTPILFAIEEENVVA